MKFKIKNGLYFKMNEAEEWEETTEEELKAAGEDAELIEDNSLDCNVKFSNGDVLERVSLDDGKLMFKFVDKDVKTFEDSKADAYYYGIEGLLRTNKDDKIEEIYKYCFDTEDSDERVEESTVNEADDNPFGEDTPDEDRNPEGDNTESEETETAEEESAEDEELKLETVDDVNTYVSDTKNPLDKTYTDALAELDEEKVIGEQAFNIGYKVLPLKEGSKVTCRVMVGALKEDDAATFTVMPDNWQTFADLEEVDIDDANEKITCNVVLSEDLVLENSDDFYKEIGDIYTEVSPYALAEEEPAEETSEESGEPENTDDGGEPAEITNIESDAANPFEKYVVKYKTSLNEEWLNKFNTTDKFPSLIEGFENKMNKFLRKSVRDRISFVVSESCKFIAVRVDKAGILEDTVVPEKFKKRLTKACEAIKRYSDGLRIVETRGSYYTRTFFLVEALESNYCISESTEMKEINILDDKTLVESKETQLSEDLMKLIKAKLETPDKFIVKPTVRNKDGVVAESYKVNNDDKIPFVVKLNECEPQIVFIPVDLASTIQAIETQVPPVVETPDQAAGTEPVTVTIENPDAEPVVQEPAAVETTQATDIAPVQAPVVQEPAKKLIHVDQLYSDGWGKLVDEVCGSGKIHEMDIAGGLQGEVIPVQVYDAEDQPTCKMIVVDIYGNRFCVEDLPSMYGNNYIIKDMYGQPTSGGTNCDAFLKTLAQKYI